MNNESKKKRGRPAGYRSDNPSSERLPTVRVTPEQLESYKNTAKSLNKTFSGWVKDTLDNGASQQ
ncbi:MAG: hypothetical protein V3T17_16655 [Pseudomonadales bacterium]